MAKKGRFSEPLAIELASGSSVRDAAVAIGCSERQAYRLNRTERVQARVNEIRSAAATQAVCKLSSSAAKAVATLDELTGEKNEPAIRLQASKAILNLMPGLTTHFELLKRIEKIESQQNGAAGAEQPRPRIHREGSGA